MKKCIIVLTVILLFINSGGFIIIFYQLEKSAKDEMLTCIRNENYKISEIVQFRINKKLFNIDADGFFWKGNNEFEYKNNLYDIIKINTDDDYLIIICVNDAAEEKIIKSFNNELNELAGGKLNNPSIKTSLSNLITQALVKNSFELISSFSQQTYCSFLVEKMCLNERDIPTPPPKLI